MNLMRADDCHLSTAHMISVGPDAEFDRTVGDDQYGGRVVAVRDKAVIVTGVKQDCFGGTGK